MTTASNKLTTLQQMEWIGADAYWVKQGADEHRTSAETIANYRRLLGLISRATGPEYQFLRRCTEHIEFLRDSPGLWWEDDPWRRVVLATPRRGLILSLLIDATAALREYLRRNRLTAKDGTTTRDRFIVWSAMQHLGKVLEEVHRFDRLENPSSGVLGVYASTPKGSRGSVPGREDWFGYHLYQIRNEIAHLSGKLDRWEDLQQYAAYLLTYLTFPPARRLNPRRGVGGPRKGESPSALSYRSIVWLFEQHTFSSHAKLFQALNE